MRTIVVPRSAAVVAQIEELPHAVRAAAEQIISALALQPELGQAVGRGVLRDAGARVVRFDETTRVVGLDERIQGRRRRGDQPEHEGANWRVVYWPRVHRGREIRFVEVLAVGVGHTQPPDSSAYEIAGAIVRARQETEQGGRS